MRIMTAAFVAIILIAFAANEILQLGGFSAAERTAVQGVSLD